MINIIYIKVLLLLLFIYILKPVFISIENFGRSKCFACETQDNFRYPTKCFDCEKQIREEANQFNMFGRNSFMVRQGGA